MPNARILIEQLKGNHMTLATAESLTGKIKGKLGHFNHRDCGPHK